MKKWNLKEVYENDDLWLKDLEEIKGELKNILSFKGRLNTLEGLEEYYRFEENVGKKISKMYSYVSMSYDQNQKELKYQDLQNRIRMALMEYSTMASFVDNELLNLTYEDYVKFAEESAIIKENLFGIKVLFDSKTHVLSEAEEKILSNSSMINSSFSRLYALLQNSDAKAVEVTLSDGSKVMVSPGTYTGILSRLENQDDRRKVFEAHFAYYNEHKNTLAGIYKGVVDTSIARMKNRGYKSFLAAYLEGQNIPDEVYLSLINTVRANTAPLKRYINLRKKFFNLDEYHTYDRLLGISNSKVEYSFEKSYEAVLKACEPMGEDFVNHAKVAMAPGHVDVYPSDGKRSGAYSTQIEGFGPYILLNHQDTLDSAFTLAHECGHSIHTLYSSENQPYPTRGYRIFVAEIPSTFNEQLFLDYLLKNSDDKELKIQALEQQIDGIVSTFYRQTLFADFEYQAHQMALEGKAFTYESLSKIMEDLYMNYYGIDLNTEELKKFVWCYIPHMYYTPFYVYQYATCFSASMKIYQDIKNNVEGAKEKYFNLLKAGGSQYPVDIVKLGGVDLTTAEPFEAVCKKLDTLLDELEKLIF